MAGGRYWEGQTSGDFHDLSRAGYLRLDTRTGEQEVDDHIYAVERPGHSNRREPTAVVFQGAEDPVSVREQRSDESLSVLIVVDHDRHVDISCEPGLDSGGDG